jgi:hypothetical protein
MEINAIVLIGQVILSAILVYVALRKAPVERDSYSASTAAQYAQAAKLKGEENAQLQNELDDLTKRLDILERKKYQIILDFTIGEPPEINRAAILPLIEGMPLTEKKTARKPKKEAK